MSRHLIVACALACACASGTLRADSPGEECEREVKQRILAKHEGATRIDFERGHRDGDVRTGFGHWRRSDGQEAFFRYECHFGDRDRVRAASFDIVRTEGRNARARGDVSEMERECREAVRDEIRREHPRASDVDVRGGSPEWRESNRVFGMSGRAELTGGSGRERDLHWRCEYDAIRERVTDVDVSLADGDR